MKNHTGQKIEDYEPGASREQVLNNLKKVAETKKKSPKNDSQPDEASSET